MSSWSKFFPASVNWAFTAVAGVLWLVLMSGLASSKINDPLGAHKPSHMPQLEQVENLGQRLAEINSAINQSLAWEGAGFKASKIAALDERINKDLDRYGADLRASLATAGLTSAQRDLLERIQQDFAKYRQTALDALDIKTGMLGNAASFMTVIDGHYGKLSEQLSQLRRVERALSVAAVEQGSVLAHRDTQWVVGSVLIAASLALIWLGRGFFASLLEHVGLRIDGGKLRTKAPLQHLVAGRVPPDEHEEMAERLRRIIRDIRRSDLAESSSSGLPPREMPKHSASQEKDAAAKGQVARNTDQVSTLVNQACQAVEKGEPAIEAVAQAIQKLDDQTQKISQTIGVFDFIAFRTNILALKAAEELAQPGAQRQDSASVAHEWLSLAQTGRDAAKEVRALFGDLSAQIRASNVRVQVASDAMARIASRLRQVSAALQQVPHVLSGRKTGQARHSRRSQEWTKTANKSPPWWSAHHQWLRHGKNKTNN